MTMDAVTLSCAPLGSALAQTRSDTIVQRVSAALLDVLTPLWHHTLRRTEAAAHHRRRVRGSDTTLLSVHPLGADPSAGPLYVRVSRRQLEVAVASVAQALLQGGALLEVCEETAMEALGAHSPLTHTDEADSPAVHPDHVHNVTAEPARYATRDAPAVQRRAEAALPFPPSAAVAQHDERSAHASTTAARKDTNVGAVPTKVKVLYPKDHEATAAEADQLLTDLVNGLMKASLEGGLSVQRLASYLAALPTTPVTAEVDALSLPLSDSVCSTESVDTANSADSTGACLLKRQRLPQDTLTELATGLLFIVRGVVVEACESLSAAFAADLSTAEVSDRSHKSVGQSLCASHSPSASATEACESSMLRSFAQVAQRIAESRLHGGALPVARATSPPPQSGPSSGISRRNSTSSAGAICTLPPYLVSTTRTGNHCGREKAGDRVSGSWWSRYATLARDKDEEDDTGAVKTEHRVDGEQDTHTPATAPLSASETGIAAGDATQTGSVLFLPTDPLSVTLVLRENAAEPLLSMPLFHHPSDVAPQHAPTCTLTAHATSTTVVVRRLFTEVARQALTRALRLHYARHVTAATRGAMSSSSPSLLMWNTCTLRHWTEQSAHVHRRDAQLARHEPQAHLFPAEDMHQTPGFIGPASASSPFPSAPLAHDAKDKDEALFDEDVDDWFTPHHNPYLGTHPTVIPRGQSAADRSQHQRACDPMSRKRPRAAWLPLRAGTSTPSFHQADPLTGSSPSEIEKDDESILYSLSPLVSLGEVRTSASLTATGADSEGSHAMAEALAEVGTVLEVVDDVFSGRTPLDASSWRYGRNRLSVVALSEICTAANDERLAFYLHETGVLHTNTGAMAALDVSDVED